MVISPGHFGEGEHPLSVIDAVRDGSLGEGARFRGVRSPPGNRKEHPHG
ncbi:hypothetical protein I8D64_16765 [Brachybacterium sp. MASK1Z-5]|uniref:Uncharacterized protein n=1 Tax=Brachybacterium halotolerans TaxID=2795215 RepID=A0ABS1BFV0_9MICO|nr:hypothetical protein [Brachybacterium halotolerans]MBK0333057.1 hypothetical protein [Brachybacterium halotolerans]